MVFICRRSASSCVLALIKMLCHPLTWSNTKMLTLGTDYLKEYYISGKDVGKHELFSTVRMLDTPAAANYQVPSSCIDVKIGDFNICPATPTIAIIGPTEYTYDFSFAGLHHTAKIEGVSDTDTPTGDCALKYYRDQSCNNEISAFNIGKVYV